MRKRKREWTLYVCDHCGDTRLYNRGESYEGQPTCCHRVPAWPAQITPGPPMRQITVVEKA